MDAFSMSKGMAKPKWRSDQVWQMLQVAGIWCSLGIRPKLAHVQHSCSDSALAVLSHEFCTIAFGKVKSPALKANVILEPVEPLFQGLPQPGVGVVQVRCSPKVGTCVLGPLPLVVRVIAGDCPPVSVICRCHSCLSLVISDEKTLTNPCHAMGKSKPVAEPHQLGSTCDARSVKAGS